MTSSDPRPRSRPSKLARRVAVAFAFGVAFTWAVATPSTAHAQGRSAGDVESARQLYNQGIELRDKGDTRGALEKFRAAHALGNTPITGLELCKTYATLAQPVEARETCLGVARIAPTAAETSRSQEARAEAGRIAEEVRARMASLRIHVTGAPPASPGRELSVHVDEAVVPAAALGEPRAVNPGSHTLVARIGNGPETRSVVELREGETKEVTLPVQAPPEDGAGQGVAGPGPGQGTGPRMRQPSNGLATAGFVVAGVGVGIGSIAGLVAFSQESDLSSTCTDKICGRSDHDSLDSGRLWANVSTVAFVIGGVGLAAAVYALLDPPKPRPTPALGTLGSRAALPRATGVTVTPDFGPGGVGVHGSF